MAYFKVPGWVGFVEKLPLTATEKIQRAGLKDMVADGMEQGLLYDMRALKMRQV
jgi:acyl-coenzyme A synthetase/AMP-(fatty) acid ligase